MKTAVNKEKWLKALANLRVDRKKDNIAPHKPLLVLVLAELVFRFLAFWSVVAERRTQKPDISLPFYHLHSSGIWTPLDETGSPTTNRRRVAAARLDEDVLACLHDAGFRHQARRVLIATFFTSPGERAALYDLVGLSVPPDDIVKADASSTRKTANVVAKRGFVSRLFQPTTTLARSPATGS